MTSETEQWLAPMLVALLEHLDGPDSFADFFESAVAQASFDTIEDVDWVHLGRLIRDRLGWHDYPAHPETN
jgi:hypothetical protein